MSLDHSEKTLEESVEDSLLQKGYIKIDHSEFDREKALFPGTFIEFIKDTQPEKWEKIKKNHGPQAENKIINRLIRELNQHGTIKVLRKGIDDYGVHLNTAYFAPASGLNPEMKKLYDKNRLGVSRQIRYSTKNENSIDIVLSLNGIPVATAELKKPSKGQNYKYAKKQYKEDRDPKELLFQFKKRAVVHFAVDTEEVYMATKLEKQMTVFFPFNKGNKGGRGNPYNPHGYRTSYLWEEIWAKDVWLNILSKYVNVIKDKKGKETLIFPRYHQLEAVQELIKYARKNSAGKNYLIQHSAGSGKSLTIGWLAHRLSNMHGKDDRPVFDSVVVITDRVVLDKQLQDTIYEIDHQQGVVERITKHSWQLKEALEKGKKIIITTLQKFPVVIDKIGYLPKRNYAVIVDEAHSSQTGESAKALKEVLSAESLEEAARKQETMEEEYDPDDEIIKHSIKVQGKQDNLSFFAFTATPKAKTLETFGQPGPDGKPVPFHLYPMRQAIEEGFIMDVLKNYTTYKTYFKLMKSIEDDPEFDKQKASKAAARFVDLHPHNLAQKTQVMVEHFRNKTMKKINGKAKAMLVTSSRLHAYRYKQEFDSYIQENGYDNIKTLVAYSGKVKDPNTEYEFSESEINEIRESELPQKFKENDEYRVLLVADKYQTGFDEPLLHTMFVDKKLGDVKAVQTLSRLNRTHPQKDDTFVLDFVNDAEDIKKAFQPFYEQTTVDETTDPNLLYDLKKKLDEYQVYWHSEVDNFCKLFFKPGKQRKGEADKLDSYVDPAVDRFKNKPQEEQEAFRKSLSQFVRLYSFLLQIIPFQDPELHKLETYGRYLLSKLPQKNTGGKVILNKEIDLEYYRLEKTAQQNIELEKQGTGEVKGPRVNGVSKNKSEEKALLSEILEIMNKLFGKSDLSENDLLYLKQIENDITSDEKLTEVAKNNSLENFGYAYKEKFINKAVERSEQNNEMFQMIMENVLTNLDDPTAYDFFIRYLVKPAYNELRQEG
ncbi:MAG: DEAD/DEAH box helicase family protein [Clostridiales bacterium]|nr:DEAD/DEAH box helicase family protein [Clostridiales bacterium]